MGFGAGLVLARSSANLMPLRYWAAAALNSPLVMSLFPSSLALPICCNLSSAEIADFGAGGENSSSLSLMFSKRLWGAPDREADVGVCV